MKNKLLIILLGVLVSFPTYSEKAINLLEIENNILIGESLYYFEDVNDKLKINDLLEKNVKWEKSKIKTPNFGYTNSAYWFKFSVSNNLVANEDYILEIAYPLLDFIDIYFVKDKDIVKLIQTGDFRDYNIRDIDHRNFNFYLLNNHVTDVEIYINIKTESTMQVPIFIWKAKYFINQSLLGQYLFGIYYGLSFIMVFYNILLYLFLKDKSFLYNSFFILSYTLFQFSFNGFLAQFLNSNSIYVNNAVPFFAGLASFSCVIFAVEFLQINKSYTKAYSVFKVYLVISVILIILSFFKYSLAIRLGGILVLFYTATIVIISLWFFKKGFKPARYFIIAWIAILIGAFIFSLRGLGVLPSNFITEYGIQIGSAIQIIFLSLALTDKLSTIRKQKDDAQKETIETQKKLVASYARFVPEQLLYFLGKEIITDIKLGDSIEKEMTILFSDIRSFTTLSEGMTPDENFGFINSYMAAMGPCIRKYNGFIDKYIGDAIMALFPEKPADAIDASIEMLEELHKLNLRRKGKGFKPISIGIGIHTGSQMLGIIGEKERLEGTVISDVVNTASRLEGLTKAYSSSILVSKDVMNKIENNEKYIYRHLDSVKVKGKSKGVDILEVLNGNSQRIIDLKLKLKPLFEEGVSLYNKKDFIKAKENFEKVLKEDLKDKASELYIERCNFYIKNGIDPDWDGIEKLDFK